MSARMMQCPKYGACGKANHRFFHCGPHAEDEHDTKCAEQGMCPMANVFAGPCIPVPSSVPAERPPATAPIPCPFFNSTLCHSRIDSDCAPASHNWMQCERVKKIVSGERVKELEAQVEQQAANVRAAVEEAETLKVAVCFLSETFDAIAEQAKNASESLRATLRAKSAGKPS